MSNKKKYKYDLIFFLCLIMFYLFFLIKPKSKGYIKKYIKIISPYGTKIVNINRNQTIFEKGKLGITGIVIESRKVKIIKSPCPNKFCILSGKIYKANQILSCVPNGIYVTIESEENGNNIDAVSK